jgi:hypothetical protein
VIKAMRAGAVLQMSFERVGGAWSLSNGTPVSTVIAKLVIAHVQVVGCGDALFRGSSSQTFRYAEE